MASYPQVLSPGGQKHWPGPTSGSGLSVLLTYGCALTLRLVRPECALAWHLARLSSLVSALTLTSVMASGVRLRPLPMPLPLPSQPPTEGVPPAGLSPRLPSTPPGEADGANYPPSDSYSADNHMLQNIPSHPWPHFCPQTSLSGSRKSGPGWG